MTISALIFLALLAPQADTADREAQIRRRIEEISRSGRVLESGEERERLADPRKQIAPGAPPILAFRYFLGADHHRFGKLEVMLDDAGH